MKYTVSLSILVYRGAQGDRTIFIEGDAYAA